MSWRDIAGIVGKAAPLLGTVLGGPAGGAVGGLISAALGVEEKPDAVRAALEQDPGAAAKLIELQERHRHELEAAHIRAAETSVREVNATMRTEAVSDDAYVRRARPTLIYQLGIIIFVQVVGSLVLVSAALAYRPDQVPDVVRGIVTLFDAAMIPLSLLAAAVGVYVRSRSTHDKALANGQAPPQGLIQSLLSKSSSSK